MKPFLRRLCSVTGLFVLAAAASAATGPFASKDETIYFTTKIHRFGEPVTVTDTSDATGTTVTVTDGLKQRVVKIERLTQGKSPLAPVLKGPATEADLKGVLKQVRARGYSAQSGLTLRETKQEKLGDVFGTPTLYVVDEAVAAGGKTVIRGYVIFATAASVAVVQYDSAGMEYAGSKRYDLCADVLNWIPKNIKIQDV